MPTRPESHLPDWERTKLVRAGRLRWFHWLVVALSLLLTFGAWYITRQQVDEKVHRLFEREAAQAIELVSERMELYENALWAGIGAIHAQGGRIDYENWRAFADTLSIDRKFPGINGIGVIHRVRPAELPSYLEEQRRARPDYDIHPQHGENEYLPITYVEPVATNRAAVGLDMAHEANRYGAAKKARDTGTSQITGPIVLVQDAEKTPGFLFYAPFYHDEMSTDLATRRKHFAGMVYAPFVVKKLMQGTLEKSRRHVAISIRDGSEVLYDEHVAEELDFDPAPLFKKALSVALYGRVWNFDIWSTQSFRAGATSSQPTTILIGGIFIDALLLALFVLLSRANRHALRYADELRRNTVNLERSNADLEQFAYVASHDLQEPLRMVGNFTQLLQRRYHGQLDEKADQYIDFAVEGVTRMQRLLNELLQYSRLGSADAPLVQMSSADALEGALANLKSTIDESEVSLEVEPLPRVMGDNGQLTRVFQNLLGNAIKFRADDRGAQIRVKVQDRHSEWRFSIMDNGIGIEPQYYERVFTMFQRLHSGDEYSGTGVGLAICKKIILRHGGQIWAESEPGVGTTMHFTLPKPKVTGQVLDWPSTPDTRPEQRVEDNRKAG